MHTRLKHLAHGHAGHDRKLLVGVEPPRIPCGNRSHGPRSGGRHPATCDGTCVDLVAKKARALYHKLVAFVQTLARPRPCRLGRRPRSHLPTCERLRGPADRQSGIHGPALRMQSSTIKTPAEQDAMRRAGRLAAEVLDMIGPHVRRGHHDRRTRPDLPRLHRGRAASHPGPLNYRGFPKSICTSVNHVVCHGIPGDKRLKQGDIVNVDITVIKDGFHGDTSRMFFVGEAYRRRASDSCDVTYEAMWRGIRRSGRARARRHRPRHPALRRGAALFRRPRVLRPRHRPGLPRRPAGPALRRAGHRAELSSRA